MSTAVAIEQVISQPRPQLQIVSRSQPAVEPGIIEAVDQITTSHPLLLFIVAGALATVASLGFIGVIVAWLSLRSYGVMHF
jgi:hypothetical protein